MLYYAVVSARKSWLIHPLSPVVPRRRVKTGFKERNKGVGSTWSNLTKLDQQLFHPPLFLRLCHAVIPSAPVIPPPQNENDDLNPIDITELIVHFNHAVTEGIVDIAKITDHVARDRLGQGKKNAQHEKKGRREIAKVVSQVKCQGSWLQFSVQC